MRIIILSKNCENYISGYYHHDINEVFMKKGSYYLYGQGYPGYDQNEAIQDVIAKSPFNKDNIDLIVVGTSWEIQDESICESDPHPRINLNKLDIPKIFFLNKEYKKLKQKLEYAKKNRFDLVCTVHHNYQKWAKQTGLNFIQLPFAVNLERFNDFGMPKKYDFGFTGSLKQNYTDIRFRVKSKLFQNPTIKTNLGINACPDPGLLYNEFQKYNVYWSEWNARSILKRILLPLRTQWAGWDIKSIIKGSLSPSFTKYPLFLNSFKVFLNTLSVMDILSPRYFECMGAKTLIFCPESKYYNNMLKDGFNCVMFKNDLSDFKFKLHHILNNNEAEIKRITKNAYIDATENHTYERRIEKVLKTLGI